MKNTRCPTGHPTARRHIAAALVAVSALCAGFVMATPVDLSRVGTRTTTHQLPKGWQHGAFMEIFVRAYADSDGDGIGDLRGLTSKLDYLHDLGIRGIWLMPVMPSADRDHGYATIDYRAIEPQYGTLADFDELLRQAHWRGIGVIVDYVINHGAAEHPLFVAARQDKASPWRRWFVFTEDPPPGWEIWGKYPWYHVGARPWTWRGQVKDMPLAAAGAKDFFFGTFGPHMPDFNLKNPEVVRYHEDSLRFWLNRGLDGFRLDATPHLIEHGGKNWNDQPESRALTRRFVDGIHRHPGRSDRYVVCEATQKPDEWGDERVCGGAFAFGYVQHYIEATRGKAESVKRLAEHYRSASPRMATFLSNHDNFAGARLMDQLNGDEARVRLAAAGYLLQPGTPFIYYGEEIGMRGAPGTDPDHPLRSPMSWLPDTADGGFTRGKPFRPIAPNVASHNARGQAQQPDSIHAFYKAMIGLRNAHPSIARGSFEHSFADGLVLGFQRRFGRGQTGDHTLVLINYGTGAVQANVESLPVGARLLAAYPLNSAAQAAGADGRARIELPPLSVRVYRVLGANR